MIPGCVKDAPPVPMGPVIVDLAPVRCPDLAEADVRAFQARAARPQPDTTGPDGKPWLSVGALQAAVDHRDLVIARMARAGTATVQAYERCRGGATERPTPSVPADVAKRVG